MSKHIFKISKFFKFSNGGGMTQDLIEAELSDYAYPYTFSDAWEWAVEQASINVAFGNDYELKSVTISYEGILDD